MTHNGNGRVRGLETPTNSTQDTVALAQAVEERFLDLCRFYLRVNGFKLVVPGGLKHDFVRWRQMRVRHKAGDFRNTPSELKSTRSIAQWTVNVNSKLRNQNPKQLEWSD